MLSNKVTKVKDLPRKKKFIRNDWIFVFAITLKHFLSSKLLESFLFTKQLYSMHTYDIIVIILKNFFCSSGSHFSTIGVNMQYFCYWIKNKLFFFCWNVETRRKIEFYQWKLNDIWDFITHVDVTVVPEHIHIVSDIDIFHTKIIWVHLNLKLLMFKMFNNWN